MTPQRTEIPAPLLVELIKAGDLLAAIVQHHPNETTDTALLHWLRATRRLDVWIYTTTTTPTTTEATK